MLKKFLILASFVLFIYSLFSCVRAAESPNCNSCGNISLRCLLSPGWNHGLAQSDDEWYGFNCGRDLYNQLKIRATDGGDYYLCKIEDQELEQCPTLSDTCVGEGEALYLYQNSDGTYWVLAHRNSGDPGFEINLYCSSGPPVRTTTTSPILSWDDPRLGKEGSFPKPTTSTPTPKPTTSTPTSGYDENHSSTFWMILLVIIIVTGVFLYKFMRGKK